METIIRYCPRCKEETPQRIDSYNPDQDNSLEIYVCEICLEANDFVIK
jgi:ribosomal protein L44E